MNQPFPESSLDVECPYCGETFTVQMSCNSGTVETIEDCMVCCRPVHIVATFTFGDCLRVEASRD